MYPSTVQEAYNILQCREETHNVPSLEGDGVAFAQRNGQDMSTVTCYSCQQKGHYANSPECPNYNAGRSGGTQESRLSRGDGINALMFSFYEANGKIPKTWILLDSQLTVDIFCNPQLLKNIRRTPEGMRVHCNAGSRLTNLDGDLPGYGTVWYDPKAIANIGVNSSDVGTDFTSCSYVPLRGSLPRPIIDVAVEPWFSSFESGLPSTLLVGTTIPVTTLVSSLASLVMPSFGCLITLARVIPSAFIRHGNKGLLKLC